jgi:hypothetical protein
MSGELEMMTDVLSLYLPELTEEDHDNLIQDHIPAEIGTEYLPNTRRNRYP